MIPKNWEELLIWLAMQFPVLAVCAVVVRWVLKWTGSKHDAEMKRVDEQNGKLLVEKETRIAERNEWIKELKADVEELKRKLTRMPQRGRDQGAEGGTKP